MRAFAAALDGLPHGVTLDAGDVILSGSLVPLADAVKGDCFEMTLSDAGGPIGTCVANFV